MRRATKLPHSAGGPEAQGGLRARGGDFGHQKEPLLGCYDRGEAAVSYK